MDRSPRRIASPVNRTPSFEIAILTSPPLSPHHDLPPMEPSPISPDPPPLPPHSFSPRRKVHESIVREVREYHLQTTSRIPFSPPPTIQIHPAPIAGPESTSSFRTNPEENRDDEEDNVEETDQEIEFPVTEERSIDPEITEQPEEPERVEDEQQKSGDDNLDNRLTQQLEAPSDRRIIFPITPFYRRKGTCSKCSIWLGALCALFFLLSIALFLVWVITTDGFRTIGAKSTNVCNTRQCIDIAFRLSSCIDDEIEPCENFYRYSCQRYHSQTADKQMSFLSQLKDESLRRMHSLLSSEEDSRLLPKSARLSRSLYSACMNAVLRSSNAPTDLLTFIRNFPCGPLLRDCQNFHADSYSWERHAGMLDWYAGRYNLIVYDRDVHPQDRSKIILQIKPPDLTPIVGLIERDLIDLARPSPTEFEPLLQLSLRQNLLSAFARDSLLRDPRDVQSQLDEVARLMVDLYISARQSASLTPNTTYMTIGEMFQALPQLYLREFLDAQLSNTYRWTETDMLSIQDYDYFARLSDIMAQTSRQAVANYLLTVTVWNLKQYSYSPRDQYGWRECVDQISSFEIGRKMYVDKASQTIDLPKIQEFLQNLKIDFLSVHRSTPLQYLSNINRLGFYVGFPRRLQNEELIWKPVSQVSLNETDYFDSMIRVGKAERDYTMSQIGTYLDNDDTTTFPISDPTMLYNSNVGAIVIPLAFIEPPIYLPGDEVPMYGIYSSLGITTLQMISKVFWQGLDKTSQLECLDNVFRGFLDANRQRSPNIEPELLATIELADAFKSALYSYAKWQNDHHIHHEKTLPAFDSTDSMRSLMLTFSTMFCSGEGSEPGSDYEAMINTVAENSRMFSIHFNCNNSSRLYNRRTCL
ncbi:Peptidase M13 N-terminal domain-containing protein [Caenorhabditis elegans]|uniref:Peptidase M13 N-terminal domain-containing protein n=2 Tax=Caenorhabditis elegans TaxID=6239 RepID=H2KYL1_CAEEL|nr:Peptidase M13 N-terminal domain-containing protein [Caenorhabditis elegans]CCD63781.1 Peptidase M13 N-terminal domain-containing protein [Caenorhabditis elegans]|eukprot:NP_001023203.2 NEPrilysin metallopeptidase family [Caenorhabditis elegans]